MSGDTLHDELSRAPARPRTVACPRPLCRRIAVLTGGRYEVRELVRGQPHDSVMLAARCPACGWVWIDRGLAA